MRRSTTLLLAALLAGCQAPGGPEPASTQAIAAVPADVGALPASVAKRQAAGAVTLLGDRLRVTLALPAPHGYRTQALDLAGAAEVTATVTDTRGHVYTPVGAVDGRVAYPASGPLSLHFIGVKPDARLLVELSVQDASGDIPQATLATVLTPVDAATAAAGELSFRTTPTALAFKARLAADPAAARVLDVAGLQALVDAITGASGSGTSTTYTHHPALVAVARLAADLASQAPADLTASAAGYRDPGLSRSVVLSGLVGGDQASLQLTDASSAVASGGNGTYVITGICPGTGLSLLVATTGTPSTTYTFTGTGEVALDGASATPLAVTAVPATPVVEGPTLTGLSASSGQSFDTITLTGTGLSGATAVRFNDRDAASFHVASATSIVAVVPCGAVTTGNVTVVGPDGTATSPQPFTVTKRIWLVDRDATGDGGDHRWSNAATDLQTVLKDLAVASPDEIWVANGTYKPTAVTTERTASFTVSKAGIGLYGGFAGGETSLALRDPDANPTILSGDIDGVADGYAYSADPTVPYTGIAGNSFNVVKLTATATAFDGFVVEGGNANGMGTGASGGGIHSSSKTPIRNAVVRYNSALNMGGGMAATSPAATTLTDVVFRYNRSQGTGGGVGLIHTSSSPALLTMIRVNFDHNTAGTDGGALFANKNVSVDHASSSVTDNVAGSRGGGASVAVTYTGTDVTFADNASTAGGGAIQVAAGIVLSRAKLLDNRAGMKGGGVYVLRQAGAPSTVKDSVLSGNQATDGAGVFIDSLITTTLTNVVFQGNVASGAGGGLVGSTGGSGTIDLANVTFVGNTAGGTPGTAAIQAIGGAVVNAWNVLVPAGSFGSLTLRGGSFAFPDLTHFFDADLPAGEDEKWLTEDDGLRLKAGVAGYLDQGVGSATSPLVPATDILGVTRPAGAIDPGAYEGGF